MNATNNRRTSTRFTELIGCSLPLQLAAMSGLGTTELAAAVVVAGGMGMVPQGVPPASGPCGANFPMPFNPSQAAVTEAAENARAVEFFYGKPRADLVAIVHAAGALAGWQVGSAAEAVAAEVSGCDFVVVQGIEAGGHVRGRQPLDEVLVEARSAVTVPLVAAGGVATATRFAELLRLGADGVRVGTRFVVAPEAGAHPEYVRRLLAATAADTVITEWFNEGWPDAPHRVLRSALEAAQRSGWRSTMPPYRSIDCDPGDMAMYAGTGVDAINRVASAASIVAELVSEL